MKRLPCAILLGILSASMAVSAADLPGQSTLNSRQIRACMAKHMSSDRTVSYNESKKACADRLKAQNQTPPLGSVGAGGGK